MFFLPPPRRPEDDIVEEIETPSTALSAAQASRTVEVKQRPTFSAAETLRLLGMRAGSNSGKASSDDDDDDDDDDDGDDDDDDEEEKYNSKIVRPTNVGNGKRQRESSDEGARLRDIDGSIGKKKGKIIGWHDEDEEERLKFVEVDTAIGGAIARTLGLFQRDWRQWHSEGTEDAIERRGRENAAAQATEKAEVGAASVEMLAEIGGPKEKREARRKAREEELARGELCTQSQNEMTRMRMMLMALQRLLDKTTLKQGQFLGMHSGFMYVLPLMSAKAKFMLQQQASEQLRYFGMIMWLLNVGERVTLCICENEVSKCRVPRGELVEGKPKKSDVVATVADSTSTATTNAKKTERGAKMEEKKAVRMWKDVCRIIDTDSSSSNSDGDEEEEDEEEEEHCEEEKAIKECSESEEDEMESVEEPVKDEVVVKDEKKN